MQKTGWFIERGLLLFAVLCTGGFSVLAVRLAILGSDARRFAWLTLFQDLILVVLVGGLVILMIRRATSRVWWEALLSIAAVIGVWYILILFHLPLGVALVIASLLTLSHFFLRMVLVQDLLFFLGAAGVSIALASWIPFDILLIGLVAFTVYDTVALPTGGAVGALSDRMAAYALLQGIIIPRDIRGFISLVDSHKTPVLLGVGDLILPSAIVANAAANGIGSAIVILGGMGLGAAIVLFRSGAHPRSLLVPLAAGAAISGVVLRIVPFFLGT